MPNHVTSIIEAPREVLDYLRQIEPRDRRDFGGDPMCDFNRAIPMPHWSHPMFTAKRHERRNDDGELTDIGYSSPGYSPLDWAIDWWGTKWNAYDVNRVDNTTLRFSTAWAHPDPVLRVLSRLFPEATIAVKYADEDLGYNFGQYTITNGEIVEFTMPEPGSDEANDFAARVKHGKSYAELRKERDGDE